MNYLLLCTLCITLCYIYDKMKKTKYTTMSEHFQNPIEISLKQRQK